MRLYSLGILAVIAILVDSNGVANRRHNNCVTWRDDLLTLTITCRVANLSQPVTISNENGGIQINCSTIKQIPTCFPSEKNTSLDLNSRTVSIELIELKTARPLNGIWQCKQGGTKLFTKVSFSRGIISDSWVNVRGNITGYSEGNRYIVVDCSSCRIPDSNYVEFLVNNRSHGSMNYDKTIGVCYYQYMKCNSFQCNCSSTGNMFQLRLLLTDDIKEIACEMHFYDGYRRGKVRIISNMQITGNVVLYDPSISEVIVKNEFTPTVETKYKTVTEDKIFENNKTMTSVSPGQGITTSLLVVIVVTPLVIVISFIVVLWKLRNGHNKYKQKDDEKNYEETNLSMNESYSEKKNDEETNLSMNESYSERKIEEDTTPLMNENYSETMSCKSTAEVQCELCESRNSAYWFCLNCAEKICCTCKLIHTKIEVLQDHVVLLLKNIPSTFSTSIVCLIHNKNEFTFYCNNHKEVLCAYCLPKHSACQYFHINETPCLTVHLQLQHDLQTLGSKLKNLGESLSYYQKLLLNNVEDVRSEILRLRDYLKADQKSTLSKIIQDLFDQLESVQKEHSNIYKSQRAETERLSELVSREHENLQFIADNVKEKLLLVYVNKAKKDIDNITSLIKLHEADLTQGELHFRWTLVDQGLGKIESTLSKTSTLKNANLTVASQAHSMTQPWYFYHEIKFKLCLSNLACIFDGSIVLISNKTSDIVVYNPITDKQNIVNIGYQPHDIEMIPKTKRAIVTCETVDKILELDLENDEILRKMDIADCARAALAITPVFILLGFRSKRIISVLQHDGISVLNLETNNPVDRLCYYGDQILYLSSNSKAIISIKVSGKEVSFQESKSRPVDIITTDRGQFFVLEESERALRKFSMCGIELSLDFEDNKVWKNAIAFCSNADSSKIYLLSNDGKGTILSVLKNVKEEAPRKILKER